MYIPTGMNMYVHHNLTYVYTSVLANKQSINQSIKTAEGYSEQNQTKQKQRNTHMLHILNE